MSVARLHRQKTLAAKEATDAKDTGSLSGSGQYELMLGSIADSPTAAITNSKHGAQSSN